MVPRDFSDKNIPVRAANVSAAKASWVVVVDVVTFVNCLLKKNVVFRHNLFHTFSCSPVLRFIF